MVWDSTLVESLQFKSTWRSDKITITKITITNFEYFTLIKLCQFKPPPPKICHTYPTMMKLGTVTPYLKETQNIYESRDTPAEFCLN